MRLVLRSVLVLAVALVGVFVAAGRGCFGSHEGPGTIRGARQSDEALARRSYAVADAAREIGVPRPKQILFGDLHVHTTVSFDAFMTSMPMLNGEGSHPQADACDFARHCSALDFWSLNDHAEAMTQRNWDESVASVRECNAIAGDPANPDTVAYLGWEWTNVGSTPGDHWGHKNVVIRGLADEEIPSRPIAAANVARLNRAARPGFIENALVSLLGGHDRYDDLSTYFAERSDIAVCPAGSLAGELPEGCIDTAEDPRELFDRLDEWEARGVESIVIPHGTTWGMYTPSAADWKKQITRAQHDPDRQTLIEVYSGHGNSEEYRDWRGVEIDEDGRVRCPAPRVEYLPRCWRAGELIRARCLEDGESGPECEARAVRARQLAAEAGGQAHFTVPGYDPEEWLDAGQCRDCAEPSFNYRPGGAAQYILALRDFDGPGKPLGARLGFMASSDNHKARPGTGYKEIGREATTESRARTELSGVLADVFRRPETERASQPVAFDREDSGLVGFQLFEMERQASFFMTGGLIAVHSERRDRDSIWQAMQRREVYGTSGPRMLLWFDLLNAPGSRGLEMPMGTEVAMHASPIFRVRAVGSFEQQPGCPESSFAALGSEGVDRVCAGECYHPSDQRRPITRIEIVRIQPQLRADEPLAPLIQDPWQVHYCNPDPAGCAVVFTDPDYERNGRDAIYYARAHEPPAPAINADGLRCEYDAEERCARIDICGLDGDPKAECLGEAEPKAWSSPIFVDWQPEAG
jgi:hypothetical protein